MHFSVGKPIFCRKTYVSAVCSGGLRIMNCSLFLDEVEREEATPSPKLEALPRNWGARNGG